MPRLTVGDRSEILIERELPPVLPERTGREQVALLVQPGAAEIGERVAESVDVPVAGYELPDRDEAKTPDVLTDLWEWLSDVGLGRHDTIVGVGGGAATDVAGFVAATWMRGIESVLVPTTLLAAVDASIGGKTGINVGGKNLVGAFWQPTRVAIGVEAFSTLEPMVYREGLAESVKHGYLADPVLLGMLQNDGPNAEPLEMVVRSVAVKVAVVSADERESGIRAHLNYGHTIGHAIEMAHGLSHGAAVAVGMVAEAAIAADRLDFDAVDEHRATIAGLGLPTAVDDIDVESVRRLVLLDKKRTADGVRMAVLAGYQEPTVIDVDEAGLSVGIDAIAM